MIAIWVRSAICLTNIERSTASRRARNSDSVMTVPRLRVKSRRSLRSGRSNLFLSRLGKLLLSLLAGLTLASRTLTTVITPSSSIVSPGTTPSPRALRRRRRLWVCSDESESAELSTDSLSASSEISFPLRRRPLPPRRRRRRNSSLSLSLSFFSTEASVAAAFTTLAALGVFVTGAA
ncbi:unannotated protein [freshwater metagenome]|uniref:Unannotated protein n=1 Tax=freshwater metagenome TaxID=449393 RepID=A0A6J7KH24_9ZZZZ